ncbi:MAG: class II fructose-bisphosphatase [Desulfuromonadaceae bacterium]|nr:class II fructose-bisphosphatase [Desulfuromonadaceae bacterium]
MNRHLALELARVTEAAALESGRWIGKGDKNAADDAATTAMRNALGKMDIYGTVVIGEGEMDEAPMLYIGEKMGNSKHQAVDIAVDPLEGTTLCAKGINGAITTIALAPSGGFLNAPDMYMDKIIVGPDGRGIIDIDAPAAENLRRLAQRKNCNIEDLTVVLLDRPRHADIVTDIRKAGACIHLISDGDVAPAVATGIADSGVDMVLGIGGAPEGVLAAAAAKCTGGDMQARLVFTTDEERERAPQMGINDPDRIYTLEDMAAGNVFFAATGVTSGPLLRGIRYFSGGARTHTVVMRSKSRTVRFLDAYHYFDHKPAN